MVCYRSHKMTALLQFASGKAVLPRTSNARHGLGTPLEDQIAENADVFTFLASQLDDLN
jgi:prolyl oligopeptidase PreP (S9A serine peptidase family)